MKTPIESLVAAVSAVMEERAAQERVFEAVKIVHGSEPCGCVKDMPGDNSTCWAHQVLRDFARGGSSGPEYIWETVASFEFKATEQNANV